MSKDKPTMSPKKKASPNETSEPSGAQESMNQLYTAHQVHTLTHIVLQRLAGSRQMGPFATFGSAAVGSAPMSCQGFAWPAPGAASVVPPAGPGLFYWYP